MFEKCFANRKVQLENAELNEQEKIWISVYKKSLKRISKISLFTNVTTSTKQPLHIDLGITSLIP